MRGAMPIPPGSRLPLRRTIPAQEVSKTTVCGTRLWQRVVLLAAQDVEMQGVEQLVNSSDLVRLAVDLAVPRHPQHWLPGGLLGLTRTGRAPGGSRRLRLAHRVRTPSQDRAGPQPRSVFP